jgi:DNA-binding GntR family transcriptional regulator
VAEAKSPRATESQPRRRMVRQSKDLAETIRSMIANLELPPGSVVSESQLGSELGCGRTPVREALLILSTEYLIKQIPGVGSTVAGLDITDYTYITELQQAIEPFAVGLAATRITDAELDELDALLDQAKVAVESNDIDAMAQLNLRFHEKVLAASRNKYMVDAAMRLNWYSVRFWRFAYSRGVPMMPSIHEHERIVQALRNHDPVEAQKVSRDHWADYLTRFWGGDPSAQPAVDDGVPKGNG